jgi:hypothetical protein
MKPALAVFWFLLCASLALFSSAQINDPNKRGEPKQPTGGLTLPEAAHSQVRPIAEQDNPNGGSAGRWLGTHRKALYEVCRKAVKNQAETMALLDKKLQGKPDPDAVDLMTEFLDKLLQ